MHWKDLRALGESELRLYLLDAWRESPRYTARERAALAWTEAVTLVARDQVPDEVYHQARAQFSECELADLTLVIATINAWNRLSIASRAMPGEYPASRNQVSRERALNTSWTCAPLQSEPGSQARAEDVAGKRGGKPDPAVQASRGDAAEVRADVAAGGGARAVAQHQPTDHCRRRVSAAPPSTPARTGGQDRGDQGADHDAGIVTEVRRRARSRGAPRPAPARTSTATSQPGFPRERRPSRPTRRTRRNSHGRPLIARTEMLTRARPSAPGRQRPGPAQDVRLGQDRPATTGRAAAARPASSTTQFRRTTAALAARRRDGPQSGRSDVGAPAGRALHHVACAVPRQRSGDEGGKHQHHPGAAAAEPSRASRRRTRLPAACRRRR